MLVKVEKSLLGLGLVSELLNNWDVAIYLYYYYDIGLITNITL